MHPDRNIKERSKGRIGMNNCRLSLSRITRRLIRKWRPGPFLGGSLAIAILFQAGLYLPIEAKADPIQRSRIAASSDLQVPRMESKTGEIQPGGNGTGPMVYLPIISTDYRDNFHYGILDSGGFVGSPVDFERYIKDWKSHGFDAALLMNVVPDLSVSDRLHFEVIASPLSNLDRQWYYYEDYHGGAALCGGNITIDCARSIIGPIVDPIKSHPSVRGYYIFDDAVPVYNERIRLAAQVFHERDGSNPASPGYMELSAGQIVFESARSDAFIYYDYSIRNGLPPCDFTKGVYQDWVDRSRETMQVKPMSVPYWAILQAHGSPSYYLRTPTVEEIRLMNWQALGEDAKGIFWFIWSTFPDMFWVGIRDNPPLLAEITDLARRVNNLKPYLSVIRKIADKFQVNPSGNSYISTLKDPSTGKLYVMAANESCSAQELSITSQFYSAKLRDLENGNILDLGSSINLRGGDGKLFEVVDPVTLPTPAYQQNLVQNPSFESDTDNNGTPDKWYPTASGIRDTTVAHSGSASLKVTGGSAAVTTQGVRLKPNTKYYASWYMKAQNLADSSLGFQYWQTSPSTHVFDDVGWKQNGSYDWVKRVGFFETPSDYISGQVNIAWNIKSGSTFWIDDLTLCEVDLPCADAYLIERE